MSMTVFWVVTAEGRGNTFIQNIGYHKVSQPEDHHQ
jgi:hypothetical protein